MKILIGGVPYGNNNVGDEAIIATIVKSVKEAIPKADITVSTNEPEATAEKLGIRTVPLLGFEGISYDPLQLEYEMRRADIYIWGGATGLSDYPDTALGIADCALRNNTKFVLYSVGMNADLNPNFFKLNSGKKATFLKIMSLLTLKTVNFIKKYEEKKIKETKDHLRDTLNKASLIIVRDEPSKKQLERCGVNKKIYATTDPAILLPASDSNRLEKIWEKNDLWNDDTPIIGICLSAQRPVNQIRDIAEFADYLIEEQKKHVLFIPMDDKTDYFFLKALSNLMKNSDKTRILKGRYEPEDIVAVTSKTSLIISSRLHLIILAAINKVPVTGLSVGTKIDKYLKLFGEKTPGSVQSFDPDRLKEICVRLLKDEKKFRNNAEKIVEELKSKARQNIKLLKELVYE